MNKPDNFSFCPRCHGARRLDWTIQDDGICYKCEGEGYAGEASDEKTAYMAYLRKQWQDAKVFNLRYKKLEHFLVTKLWNSKRKAGAWGMTWGDLFIFCEGFPYNEAVNFSFKMNPDFLNSIPDQYTWNLNEYKSFNKEIYPHNPSIEECKKDFEVQGAYSRWKYALKYYDIIGNDGTISYERTAPDTIILTFNNFVK
jgi:hypothetical protein